MSAQHAFAFDKRWNSRREKWRRPEDGVFAPQICAVDVINESVARPFVADQHYSGSFPAARLCIGLYQGRQLSGVAVFSVPMQKAVVPRYSGLDGGDGVELGRFVLADRVAYNGETWFLRRAFGLLRTEKASRIVVSYADPMERTTAAGELTKAAHFGTIYQASNAIFAGRAAARWLWLDRIGQVVSERALSKIRLQERGHAYAERQLLAAGAEPRRPHEEPAGWLRRVLREPTFRRIRHPGNFAYVFGLDRTTRTWIEAADIALPYPRKQRKAT